MKVALNRRRASWPFLSEVFFLFPQVFLQAGEYGAPWKNNRGGWEKKMGQKKKLLGEISSSPQKETQARKNVEYYINIVFPFCTDFFWKKADKPKEKTGNGSGLGIIFPIGQKKIPEPADSDIFLPCFRYAAASDFTKAKRFLVEITAVYWVSLEAQPSSASCLFILIWLSYLDRCKKILRYLKFILHRDIRINGKPKLFRYDYLATSLYLAFRS